MSRDDLVAQIEEHRWFHAIDLGEGLVTPGDSPVSELVVRALPDVTGRSVLDVGAWDGMYSFLAEKRGAERVVALDHYVWRIDWGAREAYYQACRDEGVLPEPGMIDGGFLSDDGTPGMRGFELAHEYLGSQVTPVVGDFTSIDLDELGRFDVVLYLGVLYHMVDPIRALQRVRRVTGEVAVIETASVHVPGHDDESLVEFYAGDELHADHGNWFAPSPVALANMCRAAGFRHVETVARPSEPPPEPPRSWSRRRQEPPRAVRGRTVAIARP